MQPDRITHIGFRFAACAVVLALAVLASGRLSARAGTMAPVKNPHGSFKGECALCHGENGWKPARISRKFDHGKFGFPLEGAHAAADCRACHASLEFAKAPSACVSCHEDAHRGELGVDCARCHTARSFIDRVRMVQMHRTTRFPLAGTHSAVDCEGCHHQEPSGHMRFAGTDVECVSCHLRDYQTASPNHVASGFSTECRQCHGMTTWPITGGLAGFDHASTGFPLTGAHRPIACSSCHVGSTFTGLNSACVSCHLDDYNRTTNPNHASSGFATTCADCHTTTQWAGASFDHSTTGFPLTGAHVSVACSSCHTGGTFSGLSTACVSCHQSDYDGTTDPNHQAAGISTNCSSCHTTSRWNGAQFTQHDAASFPIYSGTHDGRWDACSTCHTQASNYSVFTCFSCHPHDDKSGTDSRHSGVSGYQYVSTACYSCHPDGRR